MQIKDLVDRVTDLISYKLSALKTEDERLRSYLLGQIDSLMMVGLALASHDQTARLLALQTRLDKARSPHEEISD